MKFLLIIATVIAIVTSIPINGHPGILDIDSGYRLDGTATPIHYDLEITPDFFNSPESFTFGGKVVIHLETTADINVLRLNSKYLEITLGDISIVQVAGGGSSSTIIAINLDLDPLTETLAIEFSENLIVGEKYELTIEYIGEMREDNRGFFRSSYIEDGKTVWLGSTQFQVTHARRVFPGFDEPQYKATISLTIKDIPLDYNAISNTVGIEIPAATTKTVTFNKTPKMSTYLLAFVVSKFEPYTTPSSVLSVYGRPKNVDSLQSAHEVGNAILNALEDYFGLKYTEMKDGDENFLEKLDMVAVPDMGGAMENWGLLTYQELYLLYNKDFTTPSRIQRTAGIIAHEQTHLWFGDLVTCQWWDNAWLNEGFAQYFQYHIIPAVKDKWEMDKQFVVEQLHSALLFDSTEATHPMSHLADTPAEASAMFSSISYNKAASIIRMISHIIGEDKFKEGLQTYLKKFAYENTVPGNLLEEFDDPNIKEIAQSWIEQSNYPLVTVTYDGATKKANVKQATFMLKKVETPDTKIWSIPLTYTFGSSPNFDSTTPTDILNKQSIDLNIDTEGTWLIFNIQQTGFYRVNYDDNGWKLIKEALLKDNHDGIHELNRAQIVVDLFNLARAEVISYDLAFSVLDYLKTEEHYLPWLAAFNGFSYILNKLETTQFDMFKEYLFKLLLKTSKSIKWEQNLGETLGDLQTSNVFNWFCKLGHVQCESESKKILDQPLTFAAVSQIPLQIRESVICGIAKNSLFTLNDFETLWEYSDEHIWEQQSVLTALGCATNEEILTAYLDRVLDRAKVRHHFRRAAFDSTYTQSIQNVQFVLDYSIKNHAEISAGFNDKSAVITTLSSLAARFTNVEQITQIEEFYEGNTDVYKEYESRIEAIIATAREDLEWTTKHFKTLPIEVRTAYYRLEETIIPQHYDIEITPYLETDNEYGEDQFTFDGKVKIVISPTEEGRNTLRLHAKNLKIHSVIVLDSESLDNIDTHYVIADEFMTLYFAEMLIQNKEYSIAFQYTGSMDLDMHGFYRSSYVENGKTEYLGSTQLQTTHARRVFPGFDEPQYKATFSLTINKPITHNAYSNMKPAQTNPEAIPGKTTYNKVTFKVTPKMSTYLLAFTVAKFEIRSGDENKFGVIARPDQIDQTEYALDDGIKSLDVLQTYLKYPFYQDGIEKLDMIALPDFSAGAMENWGLITYRESNLLYDADYTTHLTKQRILTVIAHEQAHLWFGDLVTCKWWEYTWLNEGFATFFQYYAAHLVQPSWEIDKQFVVEQVHTAMLLDSTENIHPMSSTVNSPAEASAIFDNISYNKGGSVLRMIQHLIGDSKFGTALNSYLNNNKHGSATPDKLFLEFLNAAKDEYPNLNDIIIPWTTQPNYPLVTVKYDSSGKKATVTQKTFLLNKSANPVEYTWSIPLTYTTRGKEFDNLKPTDILTDKSSTIDIDATDSWLIFNVQQTGFYRVNYDADGWELISTGLRIDNHDGIHEINRAQIVDDLLNLARANEVTYEFAFKILHYIKNDTHYLPWNAAFTNFALLTSKMDETQLGKFRAYLITLLEKSYAEVDWLETEDDTALTIYHRTNVINWLCRSKYEDCINKAKELYDAYKADETKLVPINIRGPVFCSVMRNGGVEELTFLWDKFLKQEIATEKNIISQAIGCASDKTVLDAVIDKLLTDDIRSQDKRTMLTYTYTQTEENVQHVLDYVIDNYDKIITGFENDASAVITTITGLANRFTSEQQIAQVEKFMNDNTIKFGTYAARITNSLAEARTNLKWNQEAITKIMGQIEINIEEDDEGNENTTQKPGGDGAATTSTVSFQLISLITICSLMYNYANL